MTYWKDWLIDGDKYLKAAGDRTKTARFNTSFQYNVIAIALENYVMAILDYHKKMPGNHTFTDFIEALETVRPLPAELKERILLHEQTQKICSFTDYSRTDPTLEQITDFRDVVEKIGAIAKKNCVQSKHFT